MKQKHYWDHIRYFKFGSLTILYCIASNIMLPKDIFTGWASKMSDAATDR